MGTKLGTSPRILELLPNSRRIHVRGVPCRRPAGCDVAPHFRCHLVEQRFTPWVCEQLTPSPFGPDHLREVVRDCFLVVWRQAPQFIPGLVDQRRHGRFPLHIPAAAVVLADATQGVPQAQILSRSGETGQVRDGSPRPHATCELAACLFTPFACRRPRRRISPSAAPSSTSRLWRR